MATTPVSYDPLTPGYFADPYAHYADLRASDPVHETKFGFVLLTRYADVHAAYEHPGLSRDMRQWDSFADWRRGNTDGPLETMMANWLVMIDPPRHSPLRAIHERVFTTDLLARLEPAVHAIVSDLLMPGKESGGMDLVGGYAHRIPVYVLNHLLDLPRDVWDQFVEWSAAIAQTSEPQLTTRVLRAGEEAMHGMYETLGPLAEQRSAAPGEDVLSGLAATAVDGQRLSRQELLDSLIFLYQAGHPTGSQLIALSVYSLLRHPDQLELLRADPGMVPAAVEELQRFDGPVQMNDRVASEDMELSGTPLRKHQLVRLCLAAANRDPERYPDADRLDVTRETSGQLGFGHGLHSCIGAALGRVQSRVSISALLEAAPGLRLTDAPLRFLPSVSNRGLRALPVEF